jgi:hypothetical protein
LNFSTLDVDGEAGGREVEGVDDAERETKMMK